MPWRTCATRRLLQFASQKSKRLNDRIYLDNAATSWPKPESVYAAVNDTMRGLGSAASRSGYQTANDAGRLIEQVRSGVAELIHAPDRKNIAFTFNGTDALSTAILGLLKPGDHVVTSAAEHNSVLRPLFDLDARGLINVTYVPCNELGAYHLNDVIAAVQLKTRLVCLNHVSNVTGTIEPLDGIKSRLAETGNNQIVFLIDAAQSLGHIPVDVQTLGCDILAASGHKGTLGPLGTGILYVSESIVDSIQPLRFGGTGTDGNRNIQPTHPPVKFESGNLNVPGISGLGAGIQFLSSDAGLEAAHNRNEIAKFMLAGLKGIHGLTLNGDPSFDRRIGVFSVTIDGFDCHEVASILDSNWNIETRSGIHCAPMIHFALGTLTSSGTVRLSPGLFTTKQHVEKTLDALSQLASGQS